VEQGGFSAPGGSDNAEEFTRLNFQINVVEGNEAVV